MGTEDVIANESGHERESGAIRLLDRDVKLKVWVPEPVYVAMTLLADEMYVSRSEWARFALISHAFGRLALERAIGEKAREDRDRPQFKLKEPLYSRTREPAEDPMPLGKAIIDAVVLVSKRVHSATRQLADKAGVPLGTYTSNVLCWAAFGHRVHSHLAQLMTDGYLLAESENDDQPAAYEEVR